MAQYLIPGSQFISETDRQTALVPGGIVLAEFPPYLFIIVYPAADADPTIAQVKAGNKTGDVAATWADSKPSEEVTGTYDWPSEATDLTPSASYRHALVWSDGTNEVLAISEPWTAAGGSSGIPVLSLGTYAPGSLTSSGFVPRVTVTFA